VTARDWAIRPPIDHPSTSQRPSLSVLISALVWSAISGTLRGAARAAVSPMQALSETTTRKCVASASTKYGAQSSMVAPKPVIMSRVGPCPTSR
jgi:hypothetical protein